LLPFNRPKFKNFTRNIFGIDRASPSALSWQNPDLKGVFMLNEEFIGRWSYLKNNAQFLWGKFSENDFELARNGVLKVFSKLSRIRDHEVKPEDIQIDNYHYESHRVDDLPLTLMKDPGPGIKYNDTENSEFARGAEKGPAIGIDSFGEEDTFDPEEADEFQDYRNRNQNSDLSHRFFTGGMDLDKKNLEQ
jgi:hypothetical protein